MGTNQNGFVFGGYASSPWNNPSYGFVRENGGQFIFRLEGPGLGAEAWDINSQADHPYLQYNHGDTNWPHFGQGDLRFGGAGGALGAVMGTCSSGASAAYQAPDNAVCGSGGWGDTEMEMWYAL